MSTVRKIVSENKHSEGLTKFTGALLDVSAKDPNVADYIRRVRTWLELCAIDGTASGLSVNPFQEPTAMFPEERGANSWIPLDPSTNAPAVLEPEIVSKLKAAKFVAYTAVQTNLKNQARVIFQVLLQLSISRQSQAAVKNSPEWAALSVEQNKWADLLGLIVRLHTIHRGANLSLIHI